MHRLGFAFALNSVEVYRELREDAATLDMHLLEMIQHGLLALRLAQTDPIALGTTEALANVLVHLRKMLLREEILVRLNEHNDERPSFKEGVRSFTKWLFEQCMQPRAEARQRATELFGALCPKLSKLKSAGGGKAKRSSGGGGGIGGSSKEWVNDVYGLRLDTLPIVRLFTPASSGAVKAPAPATHASLGSSASLMDVSVDVGVDLNESAQGLSSGDGLMNSIEGQCASGAWAALATSVPARTASLAATADAAAPTAAPVGSAASSAAAEVLEMAWLEQVQAALDATYWTLRNAHLKPVALLEGLESGRPTGSMRRVHPTVHALLGYVVGRASARSSLLVSEDESRRRAHLRDALKSTFRLLKLVVRLVPISHDPAQPHPAVTPADAPTAVDMRRLVAFLAPPAAATAALAAAPPSTPPSPPPSCMHLALLATLRPTRVGFDASDLEACERMRTLACELCGELHARQPDEMVATLRALLDQPDASLHQRALVEPDADALETLALLEGHLGLLGGAEASLLRHALPFGAEALVARLLEQVCAAPPSASPLDVRLYSKALELALSLGVAPSRLVDLLLDDTPSREERRGSSGADSGGDGGGDGGGGGGGGGAGVLMPTRGELLSGRFRTVLLPHLAAQRPADIGPPLMAAAATKPAAFALLLALLEFHATDPVAQAEPLVRILAGSLPSLLAVVGWAEGRVWAPPLEPSGIGESMRGRPAAMTTPPDQNTLFQPLLALFRYLLRLSDGVIVLPSASSGGAGGGSPPALLTAVLGLLRAALNESEQASNHDIGQQKARHAERLLSEALKHIPLILKRIKLALPPPPADKTQYPPRSLGAGTEDAGGGAAGGELLAMLRRLLASEVPISLQESDETRRRRTSAVLTPLLDAISDREGRA